MTTVLLIVVMIVIAAVTVGIVVSMGRRVRDLRASARQLESRREEIQLMHERAERMRAGAGEDVGRAERARAEAGVQPVRAEGHDVGAVEEIRRAALEAQRQAGWGDAAGAPQDRSVDAPDRSAGASDRAPGPGADAPATGQRVGGDNRPPPGEPAP